MIGADFARAVDPSLIAHDAGIVPDPWQADLLRSHADRVLMLCSRQAGKTTTAAFMALYTAIYRRPGGLQRRIPTRIHRSGYRGIPD